MSPDEMEKEIEIFSDLSYEYRQICTKNYLPSKADFPFVFFLDTERNLFLTFAPDLCPLYADEFYNYILVNLVE